MPVSLPSLSEQFAAALSALVPFSLAVLVVGIVIWRAFEWRYQAVIEKTKSLYELSQSTAQLAQKAAAEKEATLSGTVAELNQEIKELTAKLEEQPNKMSADVMPAMKKLNQTSTLAKNQMVDLKTANNNVADILRGQSGNDVNKLLDIITGNDRYRQFINALLNAKKSQSDG
jgi:hypothetical protein